VSLSEPRVTMDSMETPNTDWITVAARTVNWAH
jgi:hypothetical protein